MERRLDPETVRAARTRLAASNGGAESATRRTAGRRQTEPVETSSTDIATVPDQRILIAEDPKQLDQLALLAAAIDLADDIAAVIDRAGRHHLEQVLGAELRQLAVSAREMSGPRRLLTGAALAEALTTECAMARRVWCQALPPSLRPDTDGDVEVPGDIAARLTDTLCRAEELLAPPPNSETSDKDLAA